MTKIKEQIVIAVILFAVGFSRIVFNNIDGKLISMVNIVGMLVAVYAIVWNVIVENLNNKGKGKYDFFVGVHAIIFVVTIAAVALMAFGTCTIPKLADDLITLLALFFSICSDIVKSFICWIWGLNKL